MKTIFIAAATFIFFLTSCGTDSDTNAHTHEDGSIHADHDIDSMPAQETFEIEQDSVQLNTDSLNSKEDEQKHSHKDGKVHKH